MTALFESINVGFFTGNTNNYGVSNRYKENIEYPLDKLGVIGSNLISPNGGNAYKTRLCGTCGF